MIHKLLRLDAYMIKKSISPCDFYVREQGLSCLNQCRTQWAVSGLCPFHEDSSAGSFKVNLKSGAFTCFSCGAKGGDIISYMQEKYKIGFIDALEQLAYDWRVVC